MDGVQGLVDRPASATRMLQVVDTLGNEKAAKRARHGRTADHPRRDEPFVKRWVEDDETVGVVDVVGVGLPRLPVDAGGLPSGTPW